MIDPVPVLLLALYILSQIGIYCYATHYRKHSTQQQAQNRINNGLPPTPNAPQSGYIGSQAFRDAQQRYQQPNQGGSGFNGNNCGK